MVVSSTHYDRGNLLVNQTTIQRRKKKIPLEGCEIKRSVDL